MYKKDEFNECNFFEEREKRIFNSEGVHVSKQCLVARPRYGPPFAGRPMGPKGPINFYWLA
jgi:hypothetical protein